MNPNLKWLRELSVRSKFSIIIALILLILLFGLINFWFGLKIMSSVRAYVGGEGLWSKAQKEAVNNLIKYSTSFEESDYENYLGFLEVTLGDKQARLELNKENPNLEIAREGFIKGGNNPEDVDDLIFLYRYFRSVSYMEIAIEDWTKGDQGIEELMATGDKIHNAISSGEQVNLKDIPSLINEVYFIDKRLTVLENHFSATLSEGSRRIRDILFIVTVVLTILLGSIALFIAVFIGKIIEDVDKIKSEFVSMASHELRTPMAAIKGFVAMVLGERYGKVDPNLKKPLQNVALSTERLIALANDLLDVARIESKGLKPKIINSKTDDIIKEVIANLTSLANQKGIKVELGELDQAQVKIDPDYVRQILHNLVGNAIKFTENGSVNIFSKTSKNMQLIYVKDSGVGITNIDQPKIFLKFQQVTPKSGNRPSGTGLGLYISQELAKKMKGSLSLEGSAPGSGSTFVLALPLSKQSV